MVLESGGWTTYDKIVCVLSLVLMSGYYLSPVQHVVATTLNFVLSPLGTLMPLSVFLLVLSGSTGLCSTTMRHLLQDSDRLEHLQSRMKELQEEMTHDGQNQNDDEFAEEQQELMGSMLAMMKLQFRPMVWSMLVTIPVFLWLRWAVMSPTAAAIPVALSLPVVGHVALSATIVGPLKVWIVWYIGGSISTTMLSRRVLARVTH